MSTSPRPPYDPELKTVMDQAFADGMPLHFDIDDLPAMREGASFGASAEPTLALSPGSTHEERTIAGPKGDIQVSILRPSSFDSTKQHSAILFYHPGGMIMAPIPFEDAYAVLKWIGASLVELSIDPARLLLAGTSGGGAICAGVTLLGRERGGPKVCGQLLIAPMLDDRRGSISARQFEDEGGHWSSRSNRFVWRCVLGSRSGTPDVKDFEAPGRATDLSGLPPTYLEVGSAEVCRDEVVAFASKLWESGVQAELHVWPGGWHNFAAHAPDAEVSKKALRTRHQWVEKHLKETRGKCTSEA
ncbi:hypothetical protein PC115_g6163 [Phytophthora cactorum]|uniref:Alpha/beta hydrolase fold-3 domain-containing protein n=1 Tax=Phytophthora cactorum TaxID=29920 RepID=A0A8T1D1M1_9STRA|nr:hypothetical protein PC115_g6163 [Phytophthora cactorum]KAG3026992.1 hypothetical protein PC120_g5652 [Phytophthora cactorum]